MNLNRFSLIFIWIALANAYGSSLHAEEKHFLLVFASQGEPNAPRTSHTFAVFVKASGAGADFKTWKVESQTISWLPASQVVALRLIPERGRNFDLPATLAWAKRQGARVMLWGPFEVDRDLFGLAKNRITQLDSGAWSYRMLGTGLGVTSAINCIHAASDLVPGQSSLGTGTAYGEAASAMVVRHYRRWIPNPDQKHDWLIERLDLKDQNLQRRSE